MATLTIPVGAQPFPKTANVRPESGQATAALDVMQPIYLNSTTSKYTAADSDPTDSATSQVVGITVSPSETDQYVWFVTTKGTVIDYGSALTPGTQYYLAGTAIGEYSDVSSLDQLVRLGYANEDGDFVVDITIQNEVK